MLIKIERKDKMLEDLATKGFHIYSGTFGLGVSEYHLRKGMKEYDKKIKELF